MIEVRGSIYLEVKDFIQAGFTQSYIDKEKSLGKLLYIKDSKDGRKSLIPFNDQLPEKYKKAILEKLGDPYRIIQFQKMEKEAQRKAELDRQQTDISLLWEVDEKEYREILNCDKLSKTAPDYTQTVVDIANAAAICRWYNNMKPTEAKQKFGVTSKKDLLPQILEHEKVQASSIFGKLSLATFERKFVAYNKEGWQAFLSGKLGNNNRSKISHPDQIDF